MSSFFVFTTLLVLLSVGPGFSSGKPYQSAFISYRLQYGQASDPAFSYDRELLREMAKEVLKVPSGVSINYGFYLTVDVEMPQASKARLKITASNVAVSGDMIYRRFPLEDVLVPTLLGFTLKTASKADTSMFTAVKISGCRFGHQGSVVFSADVGSFDPDLDTLMVRDVVLHFDEAGKNRFFNSMKLINDYYASSAIIDSLDRMGNMLNISDPGILPLNFIRIGEINRMIALIEARSFADSLLKNGFDPHHLVRRLNSCYKMSRSLTFTYEDRLMMTGAISWDGDIDALADFQASRMLSYVYQSHLLNDIHGNIYRDFLNGYYSMNGFPDDRTVLRQLIARMFPDSNSDTAMTFIAGRIYQAYLRSSSILLMENKFAEGYAMMENADLFADRAGLPALKEQGHALKARAADGIFCSYTGIASTCIGFGQLDMAGDYLKKAEEYRSSHPGLTFSDSLYNATFSSLFFVRNAECDLLLQKQQFSAALNCFESIEERNGKRDLDFLNGKLMTKKQAAMTGFLMGEARRIADALAKKNEDTVLILYDRAMKIQKEFPQPEEVRIVFDSIHRPVARIRFDRALQAGEMALFQRQFTLALNQFSIVRTLSAQYHFDPGIDFDSLNRQAMKQSLLIRISGGQKLVWGNQVDSAMVFLAGIREIAAGNGLDNDEDIRLALERFDGLLATQACKPLEDSLTILTIRADRNIALKNYLDASRNLKRAMAILSGYPGCRFPEFGIRDTLMRYMAPADYQQQWEAIAACMVAGNYSTAVLLLTENERSYYFHDLGKFGIEPVTLYWFAEEKGFPVFTESIVRFFLENGNLSEAFKYFRLLRAQGCLAEICEPLQVMMGERMASADFFIRNPQTGKKDPADYTGSDNWYKAFRAAYNRTWDLMESGRMP